MYPADLKYTADHEWIRVSGDRGHVGITDYAQQQLGDVVFVELPEVGQIFKQGDQFGSIESVKAVSDLFCPVSGEIVDVNAALADTPETVNEKIPSNVDSFQSPWRRNARFSWNNVVTY